MPRCKATAYGGDDAPLSPPAAYFHTLRVLYSTLRKTQLRTVPLMGIITPMKLVERQDE
jgi:hypothetical protein